MKCGLQSWIKRVFIAVLFLSVATRLIAKEESQKEVFQLDEDNFVLRTKQIFIPGYPHAFNPGIIRWKGRLLLNFRVILDPKATFISTIGLIWLDDDFNPQGDPYFLNFREDLDVPCRADDPRFVIVGEKLYIVYSDNLDKKLTRGGFRVHIAELVENQDDWHVKNVQRLLSFEGNDPARREKNWSPFVYQDRLHLIYGIKPHKIFLPTEDCCETVSITFPTIDWDWGILRGGTPCIEIENGYLSFFHSSKKELSVYSNGKEMPHYFMGAYLFSKETPFEIIKISPKPIFHRTFFEGPYYKPYWKESRIIFPCGLLIEGNAITISYGREDHECWIVQLDKQGLLDSLR